MERKLVKQGQNALTVTLPSDWLRAYKLSAGNVVDITVQNEILLVSTKKRAANVSITLDGKNQSGWQFWQKVLSAYLNGHDEIIILNPSQKDTYRYSPFLFGFSIVSLNAKKAVLKSAIAQPTETITELLSRIRYQFKALATALDEGLSYDDVKQREHILDTTLYYTMRFLRKYSNMQKDYPRFVLCLVIEAAADNVSELLQFEPSKQNRDTVVKAINLFTNNSYDEMIEYLQFARKKMPKKTFADGLTYSVVETLYNVSGYIAQEPWE